MTSATATFQISGWDEDVYAELGPGAKLSRAEVAQTFSGDIEGEGSVTWLMAYTSEKSAEYVGLQRVTGSLGGAEGSFLLTTQGAYDGAVAEGTWTVVAGSGTDGLAGLTGT
ncbi:MAG TPA: DUF3224 domain-containing protein, partial [Lapillicoccus sp.]|nr:DUF3224 domain-containing protein [Lapillicoccus sp.]